MPDEATGLFSRASARRWGRYCVKAVVLVIVLYALAWFVPSMPPAGVAICWAVLSIVSAIGLTYHVVMRKSLNQHMLNTGGIVAGINSGRFFSLVGLFIVSAALIAGLVFESPTWELAEWLVVVIAVPLYLAVYEGMRRFLSKELVPPYQTSKAVAWSSVIVGVLLCAAYLVLSAIEPVTVYGTATEAFMAAKQPFADSPSALLSEVGKFVAMVDGITAYGLAKASEMSFSVYLAWRVVIAASACFGIASLLGTCALELRELKLVFLPLEAANDPDSGALPVKRFVVVACILPIALIAAYLVADRAMAEEAQTQEYTTIEQIVRDNVGLVAYVLDGKYYEQQQVADLIERAKDASAELAAEREEELVPLINAAYDQRVKNVDAYLDWYYSLPADYERLAQFFTGTIESGMRDQLAARINEGVDEEALDERFGYYLKQSEALKDDLLEELHDHAVDSVPEWLVVATKPLEADFLDEPLAPTQEFLGTSERLGLSAGVGVVSGIIAKRAAEKVLAKPFFKKIVAEVLEKLALRGLLAEGGTLVAPGVGTVVGIGIGFATDYLLLKADEAMNRESYQDEIVSALEESRDEMLALVRAS